MAFVTIREALLKEADARKIQGSDEQKLEKVIPNLKFSGGCLTCNKDYLSYDVQKGWRVRQMCLIVRLIRWIFSCCFKDTHLTHVRKELYNDRSIEQIGERGNHLKGLLWNRINKLYQTKYPLKSQQKWNPTGVLPWAVSPGISNDPVTLTRTVNVVKKNDRFGGHRPPQPYKIQFPIDMIVRQIKEKVISESHNQTGKGGRRHSIDPSRHDITMSPTAPSKRRFFFKRSPSSADILSFDDNMKARDLPEDVFLYVESRRNSSPSLPVQES